MLARISLPSRLVKSKLSFIFHHAGFHSSPPIRSRTPASATRAPVRIHSSILTSDLLCLFIQDLARATKDIIKLKANLEGYFDAGTHVVHRPPLPSLTLAFASRSCFFVYSIAAPDNLSTSLSLLNSDLLARSHMNCSFREDIERAALVGNRTVMLGTLVPQR